MKISKGPMHVDKVDYDNVPIGGVYYVWRGRSFIKDYAPTEDESAAIASATQGDKVCRKCAAAKKRAGK